MTIVCRAVGSPSTGGSPEQTGQLGPDVSQFWQLQVVRNFNQQCASGE